MTNIILCGGNGTRLWPISRTLMPKQFVKLFDDSSLFQLTVERNAKVCDQQLIVSNTEQYFLALDQLEELANVNSKYLLEPVGRNTAPAIALACFALDKDEKEIKNTHINIGTGVDISIKELAETIKKIVGYEGELYFNDTKPDGTMVKLTDPSKLHALGWKHKVELEEGIGRVYKWYLDHHND
jgi:hypothetical protein